MTGSRSDFFVPLVWLSCLMACTHPTLAEGVDWDAFTKDEASLRRELQLPQISTGAPASGKRVAVTMPQYQTTQVHHMLYLPAEWTPKDPAAKWPVVVEYTGNYFAAAGSTGRVKDAGLGYGISQGKFIWVTLPFVGSDRKANAITWWGDEQATIDYAVKNVPRICEQYGGDSSAVLLCGFSRGAIAVNYIGLHNDEIAKLWRGFIAHDHYDGVRQWRSPWGAPLSKYREAAARRLQRIEGRPTLICHMDSTKQTADYLEATGADLSSFTFLSVPTKEIQGEFPNRWAKHPHNDRWLLKDSPQRRVAWKWVRETLDMDARREPRPN